MPRTGVSRDRGLPHAASSKSSAKPPIIAARAKSSSAPGERKAAPVRQAAAPAKAPAEPEKVKKYRRLLVEIYSKHAPEKNVNVDQLLEKYKGQEEFIYSTVCKRYGETEKKAEALDRVEALERKADSLDGENSSTADVSSTRATKNTKSKSVLPRPLGKAEVGPGDVPKKNGKETKEVAKKHRSTGKSTNGSQHVASKFLADIEVLLIGENSGFFDIPMEFSEGNNSGSQSEYSPENAEEELAPEPTAKSAGSSSVGLPQANVDEGAASGGALQKLQPDVGKRRKQNGKEMSASEAAPSNTFATTESIAKTSPTKEAISHADNVVNGAPAAADGADDSDFDDADLSAALAARLEANGDNVEGESNSIPAESGAPPQIEPSAQEAPPHADFKVVSNQSELKDVDSVNNSRSVPASRQKKANAPVTQEKEAESDLIEAPSASAKARASKKDVNGVKPKSALDPEKPPEPEAPPLFDQFLAVLKFLTGWNDQKTYTSDEIRDALREHLEDEGIRHSSTIERLFATIVPLLLDLKSIDIAVVKNVKKDVLRNLKIIQIYILRIVTFELKRELDAKAALEANANGKRSKKDSAQLKAAAPYLAGDISSLAKTVQHFRFERVFSGALQKLITQIRAQKKVTVPPKSTDGEPKAASKTTIGSDASVAKRKADESSNGVDGDPKDASKSVTCSDAPAAKRKTDETTKGADSDPSGASKPLSGEDNPAPKKEKDEVPGNGRTASPSAGKKSAGDEAERAPLKRQRRMV